MVERQSYTLATGVRFLSPLPSLQARRSTDRITRYERVDGGSIPPASAILPEARYTTVDSSPEVQAMKTAKDEVRDLLDKIPDGASLDEIQYHIYVGQKILKGLDADHQGD